MAITGILESIKNDMTIKTKNSNDAACVRAGRKWYQFWNNWWDWDVQQYWQSDEDQMYAYFKRRRCEDLQNLLDRITKLRPTEIILTEQLSNSILRYAKDL